MREIYALVTVHSKVPFTKINDLNKYEQIETSYNNILKIKIPYGLDLYPK